MKYFFITFLSSILKELRTIQRLIPETEDASKELKRINPTYLIVSLFIGGFTGVLSLFMTPVITSVICQNATNLTGIDLLVAFVLGMMPRVTLRKIISFLESLSG